MVEPQYWLKKLFISFNFMFLYFFLSFLAWYIVFFFNVLRVFNFKFLPFFFFKKKDEGVLRRKKKKEESWEPKIDCCYTMEGRNQDFLHPWNFENLHFDPWIFFIFSYLWSILHSPKTLFFPSFILLTLLVLKLISMIF